MGTSTYTQAEQHQHRCELVAALLSGNYAEGQQRLKRMDMPTQPKFCCLGVACDLSGLGEWSSQWVDPQSSMVSDNYVITLDDAGNKEIERSYMPAPVVDYYGFASPYAELTAEGSAFIGAWLVINGQPGHDISSLAVANDRGVPHPVLATAIAKGYVFLSGTTE